MDVDYVLVGAGMTGIILLAELLQQGLKSAVVLDRKDRYPPPELYNGSTMTHKLQRAAMLFCEDFTYRAAANWYP